ncbi:MAG TPA: response regulator [Chloroflexota bacterium]|nr:response regulator [Chloroflexota bacterium]
MEDDLAVAAVLTDVLEASRFQVSHAEDAAEAVTLLHESNPDLIILDLMLPDEDGLVLCARLKGLADAPIIICSATPRRQDKILGLKLGADDFVHKPFDADELVARVEAVLRRAGPAELRQTPQVAPPLPPPGGEPAGAVPLCSDDGKVAYDELFVGRERELATFTRWLTTDAAQPDILYVRGHHGVGKSALLRAFKRAAVELGWTAFLVDGRRVPTTPEGLLRALGGAGAEDVRQVVARLSETRPLILVDGVEDPEELCRYLQEQLLPGVEAGVKMVLAGRQPPGLTWRTGRGLEKPIRALALAGFSAEESREYLRRRGVHDPPLIEQAIGATGGSPLALSLATDLMLQDGVRNLAAAPEWRLLVHTLAEQLLSEVDDPELRELLEACAVVHQFDEATLEAISGKGNIGAAFDRLCRLSVVRPAERGLMLYEDVRRAFVEDLRWRKLETYRAIRSRAVAYYRRRLRVAPQHERAWLVAESLFLSSRALIRDTLFGRHEPGYVSVEPAGAPDHADLRRLFEGGWHTFRGPQTGDGAARAADEALLDALLQYSDTRIRVARDRDGQAVGLSLVLPLGRESAELLQRHPAHAPLLEASWSPMELDAPPAPAQAATVFYLLDIVAHDDASLRVVRAALLRDLLGLIAAGGTYLISTASHEAKRFLEECGFERIPGARTWTRGAEEPVDGWVLDLSRVGLEAWLEAITDGRPPPRAVDLAELQRELQAALLHWQDDAWLAASPLIHMLAIPPATSAMQRAQALREAILGALAGARQQAPPDLQLAYHAVELAYLQKATSHERAAERLHVSRATFYRLLKRGIGGLAAALARPRSGADALLPHHEGVNGTWAGAR